MSSHDFYQEQQHRCYHLGFDSFYNMGLNKFVIVSRMTRAPTTNYRHIFAYMFYLHLIYTAFRGSFNLVKYGSWTYEGQLPNSNNTLTEKGL